MRLIQLFELRKRPDLAPKEYVPDVIEPFVGQGFYFRFTDIPKLGINPRYQYDSPLGYYAYPLDEMWNNILRNNIPFAGGRKYIIIFKPVSNNILKISEYNDNDLQQDITKLQTILPQYDISGISQFRQHSPGRSIWKGTEVLSQMVVSKNKYVQSVNLHDGNRGYKSAFIWTTILRKLGYEGVSDDKGSGTIYSTEPYQAVFFNPKAFTNVNIFRNVRKNPENEELRVKFEKYKRLRSELQNNTLNEEKIINILKEHPELIKYVKDRTPDIIKTAISFSNKHNLSKIIPFIGDINFDNLKYIVKKDPSMVRKVDIDYTTDQKKELVLSNHHTLSFLEQDRELILELVKIDPDYIRNVKISLLNDNDIISLVKKDPELVRYIILRDRKPKMRRWLLTQYPKAIINVLNPTKEEMMIAIKSGVYYRDFLDGYTTYKFSEEEALEIVKKRSANLHVIKNPSNKVVMIALKDNPDLIGRLEKATAEQQIYALKNGASTYNLKPVNDEVRKFMIDQNPGELRFMKLTPKLRRYCIENYPKMSARSLDLTNKEKEIVIRQIPDIMKDEYEFRPTRLPSKLVALALSLDPTLAKFVVSAYKDYDIKLPLSVKNEVKNIIKQNKENSNKKK